MRATYDERRDEQSNPPEIVATIVFDSQEQPFAGARGSEGSRQVLMRAEEFDIHLKVSMNPAQRQIIGQVFARDESQFFSSIRLRLLLDGKPFKMTMSDNFGQFQFDEVPSGVFSLQLDLPHLTIVGGITIGEQA